MSTVQSDSSSAPVTEAASSETGAPVATSRPWSRRLLLILGVVLLGISLRSAVTGMSPLLVFI